MRIEVSRSGGFAGIARTWRVELDQAPDPKELQCLVDACPWDTPPAASSGADRYVFHLTAGVREATLPEPAVDGPWRELIDLVVGLDDGSKTDLK